MKLNDLKQQVKRKLPIAAAEPDEASTNASRFSFSLSTAIGILIIAALLMTSVAYLLYWNNQNRKYDISRPGEKNKSHVLDIDDTDEADMSSPVDLSSVKKKREFLEKELKALNALGTFSAEEISDQNIKLVPPEQPGL